MVFYGGSEGACPPTFNRAYLVTPLFQVVVPIFFRGQNQ